MNKRQLSHDILNILERLKIMHELVEEQKFDAISKEEVKADFKESIKELEEKFLALLQ